MLTASGDRPTIVGVGFHGAGVAGTCLDTTSSGSATLLDCVFNAAVSWQLKLGTANVLDCTCNPQGLPADNSFAVYCAAYAMLTFVGGRILGQSSISCWSLSITGGVWTCLTLGNSPTPQSMVGTIQGALIADGSAGPCITMFAGGNIPWTSVRVMGCVLNPNTKTWVLALDANTHVDLEGCLIVQSTTASYYLVTALSSLSQPALTVDGGSMPGGLAGWTTGSYDVPLVVRRWPAGYPPPPPPPLAQPAVPASGVAFSESGGGWPTQTVTIWGGTVTAVQVGSTTFNVTGGTFLVRATQPVTLTYSVAPSWHWEPI